MIKRKDNVVRMEKRATNRFGLFLLILIVIVGFGYGGYYLYQHRKEIDWEFKWPWQKEELTEEEKANNVLINQNQPKRNNNKLVVPNMSEQSIMTNDTEIKVYDLKADDKGYTFNIDFKAIISTATLNIEKVLIDGFDTSAKLTITDTLDGSPTTGTIRVNKSELDALGIYAFNRFTLYIKADTLDKEGSLIRKDIQVYNTLDYKNELTGLIETYHKNNAQIFFYKMADDKDNTYIYFDFINEDRNNSKRIKVKKLLINDELYEYKELNENIYCGANKVFYLTIPKKDIKEINNITVSFFILGLDRSGATTGIYITPEYSKVFKK